MGAGHVCDGFVAGDTVLHRLAPEAKVLATFLFVMAVVVTPRAAVWAFAVDAALVLVIAAVAGMSLRRMGRRALIEVPFLTFALFLPFVGGGARVDVAGVSVSSEGTWAAWNIVAKGTIGVGAAIVLSTTTSTPQLLRALERLRVPGVMVEIASFMVRYLDVIVDDLRRMRTAQAARGAERRRVARLVAVGAAAGTIFVRTFERGERVHSAMLARGFAGRMPQADADPASGPDGRVAFALPALAAASALVAWVTS